MVGLEDPSSSLEYQGVVAFKQIHHSVQISISKGGNCGMRGHNWYRRSMSWYPKQGRGEKIGSKEMSKESWEQIYESYDILMRVPIHIEKKAYGIQSSSSMYNYVRCKKHFLAMSEIKQVTVEQAKSKALSSCLSDQLQVPGNIRRLGLGKFDSRRQSCGFGIRRSRVRSLLLFISSRTLNK